MSATPPTVFISFPLKLYRCFNHSLKICICFLQNLAITFFFFFFFFYFSHIFIPRHTIVAGYYGVTLVAHESVRPSLFRFRMITSKQQWIFTKLGMCIDIVQIWFGIANGQISSTFDGVICPRHAHIFVSGL